MEKREKILQIFESSACLKADQMLGYLNGSLFQEELRVVELHLASCNLCQDALDGLENHADVKALIDRLSAPLLPPPSNKSSVAVTESFSPAKNLFPSSSKKTHTTPSLPKSTFTSKSHNQISREKNLSWLGIGGIAALLLLGGFLFWQYQNSGLDWKSFSMASNDVKKPTVIDSSTNDNDTASKSVAQQKTNIAQRAATNKASDSTIKAETAVAVNLNKTRHADSATTVVAATLRSKDANSQIPDNNAENAAKVVNDSQDNHVRSNSLATADIKKAEPKTNTSTTTKAPDKPTETTDGSENIGNSDYQTGKSLFQKKQYASALLYLRSAAENNNDPHHVEAMYYSALCNLQIGKTSKAKRLFKKVEKTDSPFAEKASEQLKQL